jgi:hypothetical protein
MPYCILSANGRLVPVTRNLAGECFALLVDATPGSSSSGSESSGSCITGGHLDAIGKGHSIGQSRPPTLSWMELLVLAAQ